MRFFTRGNYYEQLPRAIQDLPFGLLRTHTYPGGQEGVITEALQSYQGAEPPTPPVMMPQRMGLTRWRKGPEGQPPVYGSNVRALLGAMRHQMQVREAALQRVAQLPVMDYYDAPRHMGASEMPMPSQELNQNLRRGYVPLARGVTPADALVEGRQVVEYVDRTLPDPVQMRARALAQVGEQMAAMQAMTDGGVGTPWQMR